MMGIAANGMTPAAAIVLVAGLLCAPVLAQEKTKDKPDSDSTDRAQAILTEARDYCDRVAGNDTTVTEALDQAGWEPVVDAFGEMPYYHEIEGTKDFPGVGRAEIWGFIELYPSHIIGYCTFEIAEPEIDFPVAGMNNLEGLTGGVERTEDGVYTSLTNAEAPHHLLIQARQTPESFFYQVTDIIERAD